MIQAEVTTITYGKTATAAEPDGKPLFIPAKL